VQEGTVSTMNAALGEKLESQRKSEKATTLKT